MPTADPKPDTRDRLQVAASPLVAAVRPQCSRPVAGGPLGSAYDSSEKTSPRAMSEEGNMDDGLTRCARAPQRGGEGRQPRVK